MCRHLLVPIDDSLLAVETVRKAVEFAKQMYARITFLHVQEDFGAIVARGLRFGRTRCGRHHDN